MSNFANDFASTRSTFKAVANRDKIFFVVGLNIFKKRGKKMEPLDEPSSVVLERIKAKHPNATFLLAVEPKDHSFIQWLNAYPHNIDFKVFEVNQQQVGETTANLIKVLNHMKVDLAPIRNPRTVHYLNIHKFVKNANFVTISDDDYKKLGIEPDKELSFQDLSKIRQKGAWP